MVSFLVSDLHGSKHRYETLFELIEKDRPEALFMAGDLLPHAMAPLAGDDWEYEDFFQDILAPRLARLKRRLKDEYPQIFAILGNDDPRCQESSLRELDDHGLLRYVNQRRSPLRGYEVYGYSFVPPTPFRLKDWEKYDVSRYVDPGCVSPESGTRSTEISAREARYSSIQKDLEEAAAQGEMSHTILLAHSPPYDTKLDRAGLDGQKVDHVPLDVHVGSIAIRRFIEKHQPPMTLHGHVHESARLTGCFVDRIGRTTMLSAAHDGPELSVIRFDFDEPAEASRQLL
jgi:Icc-related predicted phosphoesterase